MGLCGNCADEDYYPGQDKERESRIQGYNARNLVHVAMFIDKVSKFINDPQQLIQGAGRLRCLNDKILSALFCFSDVDLKFNIKLLEKGDYIEAFNKAMEEFNKKSPEELGDKILETIEELIKVEISEKIKDKKKFAEIDELAVKVIENVISSFEIVYNNKRHNHKEAQDYFAKVLEYVTSKVEGQLKKAGVAVGNLSIEHNIRGIQSEIDRIERRISSEGGIISENQISSEERAVMNHIKSRLNKFTDKINKNSEDQGKIDKELEVKGLWGLIVRFVRSIIRLFGYRTELEKEKIKLEEEKRF